MIVAVVVVAVVLRIAWLMLVVVTKGPATKRVALSPRPSPSPQTCRRCCNRQREKKRYDREQNGKNTERKKNNRVEGESKLLVVFTGVRCQTVAIG